MFPATHEAVQVWSLEELKLGICNEMFEGWELADVFRCARDLGYEGVELAPFTIAESAGLISSRERGTIRRDAEDAGVEIVGLHWLFVSPKGLHLTGPDPDVRRRTRDYLVELAGLCGDVGGRVLVVGSPNQRSVEEGVSATEAFETARSAFRECAEVAAERGVTLCVEPLASKLTNFINTPDDAAKLIRAVDHPNCQMIVDVCASSAEALDIPREIRAHAEHLCHFHANDDNEYVPGSGGADYPGIVRALRDVRYEGYLSVEVFRFEPDPETIARQSIEYLREVCR